jgi:DMSO/TMAO reductase YedYZ heme-binding membrane subunit
LIEANRLVLRKDLVFLVIVLAFALSVSVVAFYVSYQNPLRYSVRIFALLGFMSLSIAVILTAFLKEVTLYFKKPFLRIHHYFAALGLTLITLHPVAFAILRLNPAVFIPTVGSLEIFLINGGRQALIIIYIAFVAVLIRRQIPSYWRPIHALMYIALFFGIVHANFIGTDFENLYILVTFNALFAASIAAFIIKRYQTYRLKQKKKQASTSKNRASSA